MALYEIALMGAPSYEQTSALEQHIGQAIEPFGLKLGQEVDLLISPTNFRPPGETPAAVAFFGGSRVSEIGIDNLVGSRIPILPIASASGCVSIEIPERLRPFNCLFYTPDGPERISTAILECVGLLPRQRRVFVSYRRDEAREAALQFFDELSSRCFDVFLDTHGVTPAEDFQAVLWHRLCDSDVLVMLDTPGYFNGRWTTAEYGRALAKGISVLRIGWPGVIQSKRTSTARSINLTVDEIDSLTGRLSEKVMKRICIQLEQVRCQSHAVQNLSLFSNLQQSIERIGGTVTGIGPHKAVYVSLPDGMEIVVFPTVGVPTSSALNDAVIHAPNYSAAVLYDHIGLHEKHVGHLEWLGENIKAARWVKSTEAAWTFADWSV